MRGVIRGEAATLIRPNGGVRILHEAFTSARRLGSGVWDFAVEIEVLRASGLSNTELRALLAQGFAEHKDEVTRRIDRARRFRSIQSLAFTPRTCLVLTETGRKWIEHDCGCEEPEPHLTEPAATNKERGSNGPPAVDSLTPVKPRRRTIAAGPVWEGRLKELRLGSTVIKQFRRPARSQEIIMAAFEEEGWPSCIDDPLPATYCEDPKRRLHHTVRNLNRMQKPHLIHFYVNGNGEHICWKLMSEVGPAAVSSQCT